MKKRFNIVALCLLLLFSCSKDVSVEPLLEPNFKTDLPTFPLHYLYIIVREYEYSKQTNSFNPNKAEYIENRLIELFPSKAYKGIYNDALYEANSYLQNYNDYSESVVSFNESMGILDSSFIDDEYRPFTSYDDEILYLQLSDEEIQSFDVLDAIALAYLNKNQLDSVFSMPNRFWTNGISATPFVIPLAFIVKYSIFRIMQSKMRAEIKTEHFYYDELAHGSKSDAFRHIFVSMHLRRYLGRAGSSMVMSSYEYLNPNPNDRDKYMDLHNNVIGRATKYWTFRGSYLKNRYDWELWAHNTKKFIDNTNNGVNMDWALNKNINHKKEVDNVSSKKYIYYR